MSEATLGGRVRGGPWGAWGGGCAWWSLGSLVGLPDAGLAVSPRCRVSEPGHCWRLGWGYFPIVGAVLLDVSCIPPPHGVTTEEVSRPCQMPPGG